MPYTGNSSYHSTGRLCSTCCACETRRNDTACSHNDTACGYYTIYSHNTTSGYDAPGGVNTFRG